MIRGGLTVVMAVMALGGPGRAMAQDGAAADHDMRNVVSANPFLLIAAWFNVEWEHQITPTATAGARVSRVELGSSSDVYSSGRVFWRYYPDGAFDGFYFGLDGGVTGLKTGGDTYTAMGLGFELGYDWLLGAKRSFYVSLGAGADRLFAGDLGGASAVMPTVRIVNLGIRF